MWWQYRKNRLAFFGMFILAILYFLAIFAGVLAPYEAVERFGGLEMAPPTKIHLRDEEGNWQRPFIYKFDFKVNMETLRREFVENTERALSDPVLCAKPSRTSCWGSFTVKWRLLGTDEDGRPCSSLARTTWGATSFRAPCMAPASRCLSAWRA